MTALTPVQRLKSVIAKQIARQHLDAFIALHATDRLTLDVGSGRMPYAAHTPNRIGIDIARNTGTDVVGDAVALPIRDASVESILATEVLEHIRDPQSAINEFRRALKPSGTLLLSTRFCFPLHDAPGDFYRFTKYGLAHLFREWSSVEIREETRTAETLGVILQRFALQCDLRGGRFGQLLFLFAARAWRLIDILVLREFGDVARSQPEQAILASGYHVVARP